MCGLTQMKVWGLDVFVVTLVGGTGGVKHAIN
jgi:hypothetical protein